MKWEYKIVQIEVSGFRAKKRAEQATQELNRWGAEGWEAVSAWSDAQISAVLMKRVAAK